MEMSIFQRPIIINNDLITDLAVGDGNEREYDEEEVFMGLGNVENNTLNGTNSLETKKFNPVPLPKHMIDKEYGRMMRILPARVRCKKAPRIEGIWTHVSEDLKNSKFRLEYEGVETGEFTEPTSLMWAMYLKMDEEEKGNIHPIEKTNNPKGIRVRPWSDMEGYGYKFYSF